MPAFFRKMTAFCPPDRLSGVLMATLLALGPALPSVGHEAAPPNGRAAGELSVDDFTFEGPSGSQGASIERIDRNHFKVTLGHAPAHTDWCNMLQFTILRNARGNRLRLDVVFGGGNAYRFNHNSSTWSYDRQNWQPIRWEKQSPDSRKGDTLLFPQFTRDKVYFGHQVPMSYEDLVALMRKWERHPHAEVRVLGKSLGGRNIYRLEVTDPNGPHPKKARWGHYFANQHPGEHNAQWRMAGMVDWLLSDEGADCRRRSICHFILMSSPDGPSHGWYRVAAQGVDMNRSYCAAGADKQKQPHEAYVIQRDLERLMASALPSVGQLRVPPNGRLTDAWAMHTWGGIVEPILMPGPEMGTTLGPWEEFKTIMQKNDPQGLVKPLKVSKDRSGATHWNVGPHVQFGISTVLCEGAGTWTSKQRDLDSGVVLIKSIAEYYKGTRPTADPKPNLVIILADDLGYGDTGTYGGWIETPHLDKLAAEGMRFTDFHSSGNVCSPTRAGLVTGRYQQRAGIPGVISADPKVAAYHSGLQVSEVTFAERLKLVGYQTAVFGKWHLGYKQKFNPMHHGFDRFRGYVSGNIDYISHYDRMGVYDWWEGLELVKEPGYVTHLITRHAIRFIQQNQDRPFCVYIAHEAVHSPYQGPGDPAQRGPAGGPRPAGQRAAKPDVKQAYRQMMEEMDRGIGRVVATVDRLGLAENTLIFFCSDNGANQRGSNGPLRGFKGSNWEGGHRVPAVARWPGQIPAGTVSNELAISIDLMPTMLALAGASLPEGHKLDGVSLLPVLLERKPLGNRKLFWNGKAMRDGPWKLIVGGRGAKGVGLYNLAEDIGERNNLAEDYPQRVRQMQAAIRAWQQDVTATATAQPGLPAEE